MMSETACGSGRAISVLLKMLSGGPPATAGGSDYKAGNDRVANAPGSDTVVSSKRKNTSLTRNAIN